MNSHLENWCIAIRRAEEVIKLMNDCYESLRASRMQSFSVSSTVEKAFFAYHEELRNLNAKFYLAPNAKWVLY